MSASGTEISWQAHHEWLKRAQIWPGFKVGDTFEKS